MSSPITSSALQFVRRALGLKGTGAQTSFLEDGSVQQTLEMGTLISAAQSPGTPGQRGVFIGLQESDGTAIDGGTMDPYEPAVWTGLAADILDAGGIVHKHFDLWLFGLQNRIVSQGAGETSFSAFMQFPISMIGPSDGVATVAVVQSAIVQWQSRMDEGGGVEFPEWMSQAQQGYNAINFGLFRPFLWPRGALLGFGAQTATTTVYELQSLWAVCPAGVRPSVI